MRKAFTIMAAASAVFSLTLTTGFVLDNLGGFFWDNFLYDDWSFSNVRYGRIIGVLIAMGLMTFALLFAAIAGIAIVTYLVGLIAVYVVLPGLAVARAFVFKRS